MRKIYTFLLSHACLLLTVPALAQNAFKLSGSNYIIGQDPISENSFTVEFWAFIPSTSSGSLTGVSHQLIAEGDYTDQLDFYVGYDAFDQINIGGSTNSWGPTGISMPYDTWTHFAVTYDGTKAILFLNGVQQASSTNFAMIDDGTKLRIGTSADGTAALFAGLIQNVGIYTAARPGPQIQTDMFSPDLSDAIAYYSMATEDGTNVVNNAPTGNNQLAGIVPDDGTNDYVASPVTYNANALAFDGQNDQVSIPGNSAYDLSPTNGGTIELWAKPSTATSNFATLVGNRGGDGTHYSVHLSSTQVGVDLGNGSSVTGVSAITLPDTVQPTEWHHWAFVNTGAYTRVYINGNLLDSIPGSLGSGDATGVSNNLVFGSAASPTDGTETNFGGSLDEVRIWNTQRTTADIQNNMNNTSAALTSTTGLVADFGFDEGISDGNNSGLTTTLDNSSLGNFGTLQSFALSGTTSNFGGHALNTTPLPLILTRFTANRNNDESLLQWETAQEQNTRDFIVERSTDGKTYAPIGTVDAAGNSNTARHYSFTDRTPQPNQNYYRLKQSDIDGSFTYSNVCVVNFPVSGRLVWYTTGPGAAVVDLQQGNNELYSLSDASGQLLKLGQLSAGKTTISGLPAGLYFVRITTSTGPLVTKVLLP